MFPPQAGETGMDHLPSNVVLEAVGRKILRSLDSCDGGIEG